MELRRLVAIMTLLATVTAGACAQDLAAGARHSVVLDGDGTVRAWGEGRLGQLGTGDFATRDLPADVVGPGGEEPLSGVVAVGAGAHHALAVRSDGSVWAWGDNTFGQLGNGQWGMTQCSARPVQVLGVGGDGFLSGAVAVAGGRDHSVALLEDGSMVAWGSRCHGQLGDGVRDSNRWSVHPVQVLAPDGVGPLDGVTTIACGAYHTVALRADGTLVAWGANDDGQLGRGHLAEVGRMHQISLQLAWTPERAGRYGLAFGYTYTDESHPDTAGQVRLTDEFDGPPLEVTAEAPGAGETLTGSFTRRAEDVEMAGTVRYPARAQVGQPVMLELPEVLIGSHDADNDFASEMHLLLRDLDTGEELRLAADGAITRANALPAAVVGPEGEGVLDQVTGVAAGAHHAVAVREDGSVWSWGYNGYAQLGHGTRESISTNEFMQVTTPTRMVGGRQGGEFLEGIVAVAAGEEASYALDGEGRAWSCGWNVYGGLAMGVNPSRASNRGHAQRVSTLVDDEPVQLEGLREVVSGAWHVLAVDADGGLVAWGHNGFGQLGDGTRRDRCVPVRVGVRDDAPDPLEIARAAVGPPPPSPKVAAQFAEPAAGGEGVLSVRDFGATGDGSHLDQQALQAAIEAAHGAGGGTVLVPPGVYRTGTLRLLSGVRLHLSAGATILGSTNRAHYQPTALIYAREADGIAITGTGALDANGAFVTSRGWRHNIIRMEDCTGVTVEGVATVNSGSWSQHYMRCRDLTLRNVDLTCTRPGRNNDGFDITGCEKVLIEGCVVASDDDCIVIKSFAAREMNRNVVARNNIVYAYASGFKLGTETRSIYEDIVCDGLQAFGGTTLGLYSVDGANTSGVRVENVFARASRCVLGIALGARLREGYFAEGEERVVGSLEDVIVRNVDARVEELPYRDVLQAHGIAGAEMAHQLTVRPLATSFVSGLPEAPIRNVLLEEIRISHPGGGSEEAAGVEVPERPEAYPAAGMFGPLPAWGLYLRHAEGVTLREVESEMRGTDARPAVVDETEKD